MDPFEVFASCRLRRHRLELTVEPCRTRPQEDRFEAFRTFRVTAPGIVLGVPRMRLEKDRHATRRLAVTGSILPWSVDRRLAPAPLS